MFCRKIWAFSDGFSTGQHRAQASSSTIFSMMCMIIGRKTYVKIELEQTKAKYKEKMAVFAL